VKISTFTVLAKNNKNTILSQIFATFKDVWNSLYLVTRT